MIDEDCWESYNSFWCEQCREFVLAECKGTPGNCEYWPAKQAEKPVKVSSTPRTDEASVSSEFIAREMDVYKHKFVLSETMRAVELELAVANNRVEHLTQVAETRRLALDAQTPELCKLMAEVAMLQALAKQALQALEGPDCGCWSGCSVCESWPTHHKTAKNIRAVLELT